MGRTLMRNPCLSCGSKDNLITWEDDNGSRFTKCKTPDCYHSYSKAPFPESELVQESKLVQAVDSDPIEPCLTIDAIPSRGISKEICLMLEYYTGIYNKKEIRAIKVYNKLGFAIGYKIKWVAEKKYTWYTKGKWVQPSGVTLLGLKFCDDYSKPLIITEGEEDALSLWEIGYQACSLTGGCQNVLNDLSYNIEELKKYSEIILCLDNDGDENQKGKKATKLSVEYLKSKVKLKVCELEYKDANEALLNNKEHLIKRINEAKEYIPPGITYAKDLDLTKLSTPKKPGIDFVFPETTKKLRGLNFGTLTVLAAGASIGKSSVLRVFMNRTAQDHPQLGLATYFIEESEETAPKAIIALESKIPVGDLAFSPQQLSKQLWREMFDKYLNTDRLTFVNDDFVPTMDNVIESMEYYANIKNFKVFIIDHLTAVIAGTGIGRHGERRDIDEFFEKLYSFTRRTQSIVIVAAHLTKISDGSTNWDEGRVPSIYDIKGSGSFATKPDNVILLVRNLKDPEKCDKMDVYIGKNRWFSKVGYMETMGYMEESGSIEPLHNRFKHE